uniref:Uncharacterized protein n=1 Tax=Amphimedon queenslandica TaxID=400682 RepID=A0A1X7VJ76_AMPQE
MTYFSTRKRRIKTAESNSHKDLLMKQWRRQRKHNKLQSRKVAIKSATSLSTKEKEKLNEESGSDTEERRMFVIDPLPCLSDEAKSHFQSRDRKSSRRTERGAEMMTKRKEGMPSQREAPEDCPEWALCQES